MVNDSVKELKASLREKDKEVVVWKQKFTTVTETVLRGKEEEIEALQDKIGSATMQLKGGVCHWLRLRS